MRMTPSNSLQALVMALPLLVAFAHPLSISAQPVVFTYQGRVQANGTNFSGMGRFKFALVTTTNLSRQGTATAIVTSGFVTGCTVLDGGNGYTSAPSVSFSGGGGAGAAATADVSGGAVTSIIMNNAGSGYASAPIVIIGPPAENIAYTTVLEQ